MLAIIKSALEKSYTYSEYRTFVSKLISEGKSTGNEQSADLLHYSELNEVRMNRLEKTLKMDAEILASLQKINSKQTWLVIAEGWCGDVAQILPILNKMALESNKIDLRIVFRDLNDDVMNHFLTNGARAIPKLIIVDKASGKVCNHWGPRPKGASDLIKNYKEKFGIVDEEAKSQLKLWYLKDKGFSTQNEVVEMMQNL